MGSNGKEMCRGWKDFGVCRRPPGKECMYSHDPKHKGPTDEGTRKTDSMKKQSRHQFVAGTCKRGETCFFQHDPAAAKAGPKQRAAAASQADAPTGNA